MRLIDKFLSDGKIIVTSDSDGKVVNRIIGTNPKTGEAVDLIVDMTNILNKEMWKDTLTSALEEHLNIKYDYGVEPDLQEKLDEELEEFLSLPQEKGVKNEGTILETDKQSISTYNPCKGCCPDCAIFSTAVCPIKLGKADPGRNS